MNKFYVNLANQKYPIMVGRGLLSKAGALLSGVGFDSSPIVISNSKIWRLHGSVLERSLKRAFGPITLIRIGDGEKYKDQATLLKIYEAMFRARADRRSWILAFGGGVIGDISGFAAATFMRGIPYVIVPTTLLAQVDSSVGGKVAINVKEGKNLIGAFYQPKAVLTDIAVLKTLEKRELASGLYEVIKSAAIDSGSLLRRLERNLPAILGCRPREMEDVVVNTGKIKARIVGLDEKESGVRMVLNFGHTVGHAFETATDYTKFKHGEAVAWGVIAALEYGAELGYIQKNESERLIRLIRRVGPLPALKGISLANLWSALTPPLDREPLIYGFSLRVGSDEKPRIQQFGNTAVADEASSIREPLTDIIEEKDKVRVVVELPGVEKEEIHLHATAKALDIEVNSQDRKFSKHLDLPCEIRGDNAKATYKNGVLQILLERSSRRKKKKEIRIE